MPFIFLLQILLLVPLSSSRVEEETWIKNLFDYQIDYESLAEKVQTELLSAEDLESFFSLLLTAIEPYRYQSIAHHKNMILDIIRPFDDKMAEDIGLIIDVVVSLLESLQIQYHDIQHTLEVTLGTAQACMQGYKEGKFSDYTSSCLPIVAALFHDIGYSNAEQAKQWMQSLPKQNYASLFLSIHGQIFLQAFEETLQAIAYTPSIGAEMHLYHVHFSQVLLPHILQTLPSSSYYKEFFLNKDSLESICSMIALTDIKRISQEYRDQQRVLLSKKNLLFGGDCLATCDLYTQLSTIDKLHKGLGLYHEFFIGKEVLYWKSGLALIASNTQFYEQFAKQRFDREVLLTLHRYFADKPNPHEIGLAYSFFLHKLFANIYAKLQSEDPITDQDLSILQCLQKHGLQPEIVDIFLAAKYRKNCETPSEGLLHSLRSITEKKGSFLEINLAEEIFPLLN